MNAANSNCVTEVTTSINTIDQNTSLSNLHLNIKEFEAVVEPYAIDVWKKCCRICKVSKEFKSENALKNHFINKHPNVSMEYYDVKSRNLVRCSACGKQLKAKGFLDHKLKVHQNVNQSGGIEEPYAIDVLTKCCKICKMEYDSENALKKHFMAEHTNVPMKYDVVKSRNRVICSGCGTQLNPRVFYKHILKVHAQHLTDSISQNKLPNVARDNIIQSEEIEEPYAIDIPLYICSICKGGPMHSIMTKRILNIHFKVKHSNTPQDFDVVKSDERVKCSSCGVKMCRTNFVKHVLKVHNRNLINIHDQQKVLSIAHHNTTEGPYAVDLMVKRCEVCKAEYVTHKFLKKHFEDKHENAPIKFDVVKSYKYVNCSACRTKIKTENFTRHKQRCVHSQAHIGITSQKALQVQVTNYQLFHVTAPARDSKHPLVNETLNEDKKYAMKLIKKECVAIVNVHKTAPRLFGCKLCGANNILEQNITKHHMEHHPDSMRKFLLKALNSDFYLLESKKKVQRLQCEICKVECNDNHLGRHMRRVHSKSFVISENEPSTANHSERSSNDIVQVNTGQQLIPIKVYKCLACDASDIMEPNLLKHHLKKHAQISIEVNIFQMNGQLLRGKCNICQRYLPEGCIKAHKKHCHSNMRKLVVFDKTTNIPNWSNASNRTVIQKIEPVNTELHKCLKCRAVVSKDKLQVHRKNHKKVSKTDNIFQLIGIKNVIKCAACLTFIAPESLKEHMKKHSTMKFVSSDGEPLFNPESENKQKFEQKSFVVPQNFKYLPKYRNIYKCRACEMIKGKKNFIADTGLDGMKIQKHQRTHRNDSIKGNIFRFFMVKVKCNVCDQYLKEDKVEKHMKFVHNWNYDINFVPLYKCGGCDRHGISKRNLDAHHSKMHSFPIERNNFKICAIKQKIECECCGKRYMEGRSKKHQLKTCLQRALAIETVMDEEKAIVVFEDDQLATDDIF